MDAAFYRGFTQDLHDAGRWRDFYQREAAKHPGTLGKDVPPVPTIDGEWLFNEMMRVSIPPDPWMYPALKNLKASGKYTVAALTNTVIFPPGHELYVEDLFEHPVRRLFDVYISSAHIGIRKPDPKMYEFAYNRLREHAEGANLQPGDILFLDDIGENLRGARNRGFRTFKVPLGRAYEAVAELERITGLKLAGDYPKTPIETKVGEPRARI